MLVHLVDEGGVLGDLGREGVDVADDLRVDLDQRDDLGFGRPYSLLLEVDLVEERSQRVLRAVGRGGDEEPDEEFADRAATVPSASR